MFARIADPTFDVPSDTYYRNLLAKVGIINTFIMIIVILCQMYTKGKATVKEALEKDNPSTISLALDGWTAHHHDYLGAIASNLSLYLFPLPFCPLLPQSS